MKKHFLFLILIILSFPLSAEEESVFIINSYTYYVTGMTKPFALNYIAGFYEGQEITGLNNLELFIQEKTRILLNERVLESVRIDYIVGASQNDGKLPVDIFIHVKDTWNIMVLPYPQYSSNSGFSLTLKARDYNFLGLMAPLRIDLGYSFDQNRQHFFNLMIDSNFPFTAFGLNWNADFDHEIIYRPNLSEPWFYRNTTGISVELPFRRTVFTFGFSESFIVNEEYSSGSVQEGLYMSSRPYTSWRIPTGLRFYDINEFIYSASVSATFNHEFPRWPLIDSRKGPYLSFSHSFGVGRVDWIENFRRGLSLSARNSFTYDFFSLRSDLKPWSADLNITAAAYLKLTDFWGLYTRIMYRHWFFDDYSSSAGDVLRGVLDNWVSSNFMLSINVDIPFRVLKFRPSQWFPNRRFFRPFDFDLHVSPFFDLALFNNPKDEREYFGLENMLFTVGIEAIIFPIRWRSLFLRISYGRNLSFAHTMRGGGELFVGMELHY